MKNRRIVLIAFISLLISGCQSFSSETDVPDLDETDIQAELDKLLSPNFLNAVFTNVNIISMKNEEVNRNMDLFVKDRMIERIEPHTTTANYSGYEIIDGNEKYLIPGLSDMHMHVIGGPHFLKNFFLYIAHGVTTIRSMWGSESQLQFRDDVNNGLYLSPRLFVASPGFDGARQTWPRTVNTSTPEQAVEIALDFNSLGYDLIKIYNGIPKSHLTAVLDAISKQPIRAVGHVPSAISIEEALNSEMSSLEHLWKYATWSSSIDINRLQNLAEITKRNTIWNCPTLSVTNRSTDNISNYERDEMMDLISPEMKEFMRAVQGQPVASAKQAETIHSNQKIFIKILSNTNADIISGTDTGLRYVFPGKGLIEELNYYQDAGLTPFQVLKTSTSNVGRFMNDTKLGTIQPGNYADLLLLDANPLLNISHIEKRAGVMVSGTWFSAEEINEILKLIDLSYQ